MKQIMIVFFLLMVQLSAYSQDYSFILHRGMLSIQEDVNSQGFYDNLNNYLINPIDLNQVTKDDLLCLGLLNEDQIENLLYYLYTNGEIQNLGELRLVEGFDHDLIQLVKPYLTIKPKIDPRSKSVYFKHNFVFRSQIAYPFRDGFLDKTDSLLYINKKYYGDPLSLGLKYSTSCSNGLAWGISSEKDPGETLGRFPDYFSFYFSMEGKKYLKRLIAGDFKISLSQGLIINNGFSMNAMMDNSFRRMKSIPIRKHNSWNESDYLRGVSAYFEFDKHSLTTFVSYKNIDATIKDSSIVSINKSGLHRNIKELQNRKNVTEAIYGLSWSTYFPHARIDFSFLYSQFSLDAKRLLNAFDDYAFNGNRNLNLSFGWSFNKSIFFFKGEEAISKSGGYALSNSIQLKPIPELFMTIGQRFFSPDYHSFYGKYYGNSSLNNEEGYLFKLDYQPFSKVNLSGCFDFFRIPLMKASSPFPSNGYNAFVNLGLSLNPLFSLNLRYKRNLKEKEEKEELDDTDYFVLLESYRDTYQVTLTTRLSDLFLVYTAVDYSFQSGSADNRDQGYHISQSLKYSLHRLHIMAALSVYYSDRGKLSFYSVNKQIQTGTLFSRLSGSGYKLGASMKWEITDQCKLSLSYSFLKARGKDNLYSGLNLLPDNFENMLSINYSWRF